VTLTTKTRLEALAAAEGWKVVEATRYTSRFERGDEEVTVGYQLGVTEGRPALKWIALFCLGQPIARYGLFGKQGPGTGGGEIRLHVPNKAKIVTDWLTR
jgi:hypothetical protein